MKIKRLRAVLPKSQKNLFYSVFVSYKLGKKNNFEIIRCEFHKISNETQVLWKIINKSRKMCDCHTRLLLKYNNLDSSYNREFCILF